MSDPNKNVNQEKSDSVKPEKDEKIQITDDEAKNVAAGAGFWFWDKEKRKPKEKNNPSNPSNGG